MLLDTAEKVAHKLILLQREAERLRREVYTTKENIKEVRETVGSIVSQSSVLRVRNGLGDLAVSFATGGKLVDDNITKIANEYTEDVRPFVEYFLRSEYVLPGPVKDTMPPGGFDKNARAVEGAGAFSMCSK